MQNNLIKQKPAFPLVFSFFLFHKIFVNSSACARSLNLSREENNFSLIEARQATLAMPRTIL